MDVKERINNRIHELEQNIVSLREDRSNSYLLEDLETIDWRIELYSACIMELKKVLEWINN